LTSAELDERLGAAEEAVREAGRLALDLFARRAHLRIDRKGAQDLVSEADRSCEDVIIDRLSRRFSGDGFLGEEGGARNPGAAAIWVIDPIDGTHNFLTGVPFWCVSVALVVAGEPVLGLIHHPIAGEFYSASAGGGAYLNGEPIGVSGETDLTRARVCVGFSYRRPVVEHTRVVEALLSAGCEYLRLGSGALGLAFTAAGRFDGYWERHINSWDAAAGLVLVREAGGAVDNLLADTGLTRGGELLASTRLLFDGLKHLTSFR
jgi:myo-inositol-1(or 4)-monophosphatase